MLAALAAAAVATVGCSDRSEAGFPGAYRGANNVVAGPLSLVGAGTDAREAPPETITRRGAWKSPMLLRNGHTATISIAPAFRAVARLQYAHGTESFAASPSKLRVKACRRGSGSTGGGRPVTFWSGGIALRSVPACVEILVRADGGSVRRRALRFATGDAPPSAGPRRCT
jgi:hypothetical protein